MQKQPVGHRSAGKNMQFFKKIKKKVDMKKKGFYIFKM